MLYEQNTQRFVPLIYYIIYKSEMNSGNPVVFGLPEDIKNTKHFFDNELESILDVINMLLHFPRFNFDFSTFSPTTIKNTNNLAQYIFPVPEHLFKCLINENYFSGNQNNIFIFYDDKARDLYANTIIFKSKFYTFDEVLDINLKELWDNFIQYNNGVAKYIEFLPYPKSGTLPILHFADQIDKVEKKIFELDSSSIKEIAEYRLKMQGYLDGMEKFSQMEESELEELSYESRQNVFAEALLKAEFPITITLPGLPKTIDRLTSPVFPDTEEKMLRLMGIHNSISNNGIHMPLKTISEECFIELNSLENHCKGTKNNRYIWRALKKLGKLISQEFTEHELEIIQKASNITVFSDFPIGLAILPGSTAPLCCVKPISYKPITPLTRAAQIELGKVPTIPIQRGTKILIIECLATNDRIRKASDDIWEFFIKSIDKNHFNVVYEVAETTLDFDKIIRKHSDTTVLIISAHGVLLESNMTAIKIGEQDIWSPIGNNFKSPPIVLFSACHVSPRSTGAVSIADLFIRNGAQTVLGTLVPVDVNRNGILMIRLFVYLSETLEGKNEFKNLSEVWRHVVSSNAVLEIIEATKALKAWSYKRKEDNTWPLYHFQMIDSVGKLKYKDVYLDSIKILKEIADRDGMSNKLNNALREDNSFPESVFYQLIGSPENVLIIK